MLSLLLLFLTSHFHRLDVLYVLIVENTLVHNLIFCFVIDGFGLYDFDSHIINHDDPTPSHIDIKQNNIIPITSIAHSPTLFFVHHSRI